MNNLAVANGLTLSPYSSRRLPDGRTSLQGVLERARRLPGVGRVLRLLGPGSDAPVEGFEPLRLQGAAPVSC